MDICVDTSIIIDHLRRKNKTESYLTIIISKSISLHIVIVSIGELYSGLSASKQDNEIQKVLAVSKIINLNHETAKFAGEIRRTTHIALMDAFIAATAISLDIPLVTLNVRDFAKVKGLNLYQS